MDLVSRLTRLVNPCRIALAAALCFSSTIARAENQSFSDFSGGLNTRQSGILLAPNESPSLLNVLLDETGSGGISRRKGFSKLNSSAIGGGSSDVNAAYQLEQSDGDKYCIAFSSTNGYYSTDGCGTFTSFVSTLTRNNDVNCDAYGDNLYCVNNQYDFKVTGTDEVSFAGPSDLNVIRVFRNRCFGAGKDTNPSRLYWSNLGDCDTWTTSTDYVDIDAEDGDVTVGIGPPLFDLLPVYKKFSAYVLQFDNANTSNRKIITVSKSIGAKSHRAIANHNNRQYFESVGAYGGQPGIYVMDGLFIQEATEKLRGEADTLSNLFANTGRKTTDTKADYDAGVFDSYAMSASRDAGFMQSSYTALTQTTADDWSAGTLVNLSTTGVLGSLTLSSTTLRDEFSDGNYTTGGTTWTVTAGSWDIANNWLRATTGGTLANTINAVTKISSGAWSFDHYYHGADANVTCSDGGLTCFEFRFLKDANGYYYALAMLDSDPASTTKTLRIIKNTGSSSVLSSWTQVLSEDTSYSWTIYRTTSGIIEAWSGGVFKASTTDTAIGSPHRIEIAAAALQSGGDWNYNYFDNIYAYRHESSGTWTSPTYDMSISTPVWGTFTASMSSDTIKNITFDVQSSTANNGGGFESYVSQTNGAQITASKRRYFRYRASFSSPISSDTVRLNEVTSTVASTGTWRSPELFLSNAMTSFGTFQTEQTVTGAGASIAYALYITTYSGSTWPSTGSVTATPGSAISHSTGSYVVVVGTWTVFSASETAKTDSIVINWNEGTSAKSATLSVYKNRLHYCAQTQAGTVNDVCYVLDSKGAWVKWTGIHARHLNVIGQNFVASGSTESSGGFLYKLYDTDSDAGAAINASWESKDHAFDKIQNVKAVDRIYLLGSNDATTLTVDLLADSGLRSRSYSVNLSTGADFRIINKVVSQGLNGNTFRLKFSNNAASKPWSIYGYGLLYRDLGLMQP